jgi:enoyl-CoA hydratase/carnithine racemase
MDDPLCAAVILTGAGDTFCSGGDLSSMPTEEEKIRIRLGEMHDIVRLLHAGPKPTVSVVDGAAFGSGFSIAAACDHVIATEEAMFGCSFGKVGLIADSGLIWTLPRRVGAGAARSILLENRNIGALEAYRLGIVDEVAGRDHLARAKEWAAAFQDSAPSALCATKRLLADTGGSLDDFLAAEADAQVTLLAGADFREGRSAFFERRPPSFHSPGSK